MRRIKRRGRAGLVTKVAELALAAPQVVAIRSARMLAAGANPDARDRAEFNRMGPEKVAAFWESMFAMGRQLVTTQQEYARSAGVKWLRIWTTPWWLNAYRPFTQTAMSMPALAVLAVPTRRQRQRAAVKLVEKAVAPVHKRATANSRRLTRVKKRRA
jgi:hypothetical protein